MRETLPLWLVPLSALALASLPSAQGFVQCTSVLRTYEGEAGGDQFGWVSSPIPDVTGDGVSELFISAPFHDTGGNNAGRVYLYDGATGVELFHADGDAAGLKLGFSVRDVEDFDGDGKADVIAGGNGIATSVGTARVFSSANDKHIGSPDGIRLIGYRLSLCLVVVVVFNFLLVCR